MGAYCRYEMEKQRNRRAQVDNADDAEGVLVGEMVDAFDDADADETAVAVADEQPDTVLEGVVRDDDDNHPGEDEEARV